MNHSLIYKIYILFNELKKIKTYKHIQVSNTPIPYPQNNEITLLYEDDPIFSISVFHVLNYQYYNIPLFPSLPS